MRAVPACDEDLCCHLRYHLTLKVLTPLVAQLINDNVLVVGGDNVGTGVRRPAASPCLQGRGRLGCCRAGHTRASAAHTSCGVLGLLYVAARPWLRTGGASGLVNGLQLVRVFDMTQAVPTYTTVATMAQGRRARPTPVPCRDYVSDELGQHSLQLQTVPVKHTAPVAAHSFRRPVHCYCATCWSMQRLVRTVAALQF